MGNKALSLVNFSQLSLLASTLKKKKAFNIYLFLITVLYSGINLYHQEESPRGTRNWMLSHLSTWLAPKSPWLLWPHCFSNHWEGKRESIWLPLWFHKRLLIDVCFALAWNQFYFFFNFNFWPYCLENIPIIYPPNVLLIDHCDWGRGGIAVNWF